MPTGPKGEKRPADVNSRALMVAHGLKWGPLADLKLVNSIEAQ
jgi:hypothetical protein